MSEPFTVAAVPGVTLTKWTRAWDERRVDRPLVVRRVAQDDPDQLDADVRFVRLPIDGTGLHVIPLYEEAAFVVVPEDHPLADVDEVTLADLAGEQQLDGDWAAAIELVAANVGVVVVPQSIARLHARRDIAAKPVTDAPPTRIALAWSASVEGADADDIEEFVGIVRGRTAHSSRTTPTPPAPKPVRAPKSARPPARKKPQRKRRQGR